MNRTGFLQSLGWRVARPVVTHGSTPDTQPNPQAYFLVVADEEIAPQDRKVHGLCRHHCLKDGHVRAVRSKTTSWNYSVRWLRSSIAPLIATTAASTPLQNADQGPCSGRPARGKFIWCTTACGRPQAWSHSADTSASP